MQSDFFQRISITPGVMAGKPVIRDTRIPVDLIVRMVAQGLSSDDIMNDYPRLTPLDIRAALLYAAATVSQEDIYPIVASTI